MGFLSTPQGAWGLVHRRTGERPWSSVPASDLASAWHLQPWQPAGKNSMAGALGQQDCFLVMLQLPGTQEGQEAREAGRCQSHQLLP